MNSTLDKVNEFLQTLRPGLSKLDLSDFEPSMYIKIKTDSSEDGFLLYPVELKISEEKLKNIINEKVNSKGQQMTSHEIKKLISGFTSNTGKTGGITIDIDNPKYARVSEGPQVKC